MPRQYRRESWIDPRLELGDSAIHGQGVIAREPIPEGEVVIVWGGVVMSEEDIRAGRAKPRTAAEIGEGVYLASEHDDPDIIDDYINHSCDSHLWFEDEVTLSVRRLKDSRIRITLPGDTRGSDPRARPFVRQEFGHSPGPSVFGCRRARASPAPDAVSPSRSDRRRP